MSRPTNFVELAHAAPAQALLRVLWEQRQRGELSATDYAAAFARVYRGAGVPCDACGVAVAYVRSGERRLCATCALGESEKRRAESGKANDATVG